MNILLLGSQGQVGRELQARLAPLGAVTCVDRAGAAWNADLADAAAVDALLDRVAPGLVVNAAAYTAVDQAEREPQAARAVNAALPARLAGWAARHDAWLVHYGTEYVFDGTGDQPRDEDAPAAPLNEYGRSKLAGEVSVRGSGGRHLLLRTSWVHGLHGGNFPKTILRLAAERDELRVVDDQVGAPTGADLLAQMTVLAVERALRQPQLSGLWHVAASGFASWHEVALRVVRQALSHGVALRLDDRHVLPIPSSQYPTPARRPLNSRLDCRRFESAFGVTLPRWEAGIDRLVAALASSR